MAVAFHSLTVADIRRETADSSTITLAVPPDVMPMFRYKHGQYLTLRVMVDGVEHRRNYSLCSSPYDDEPLTIGVKRVADGAVSTYLNERLAVGDSIDVYPPMGNFSRELDPAHQRKYVLFGGGSGITPLLSIIKSILRIEPRSSAVLFYANRSVESTMFASQLSSLEGGSGGRLRVIHILENTQGAPRSSYGGRMETGVVHRLLDDAGVEVQSSEYFVCGPAGMMANVLSVLAERGVDEHHIHREYFTMSTQSADSQQNDTVEGELAPRTVTIRLYGQEHTFLVHPDETILTAAQRENIDPPYACQIGACCTCRAKLLEGKVRMDEREALSDDEMADGYILTCQSHPLTDGCIADYDL